MGIFQLDEEKHKNLWYSYENRETNFPIGCTIRKWCLIRNEYKYATVVGYEKDTVYTMESLVLVVRWIDESKDKKVRLINSPRVQRVDNVKQENISLDE